MSVRVRGGWRGWAAALAAICLAAAGAAITHAAANAGGGGGATPQGIPAPTATPTAIKQHAVLTILVNWAASGGTPADPADSVTQNLMNNQVAGASSKFQQYAYTQFGGWPGQAVGPVTIPTPPLDANGSCGNVFSTAVRSAAYQAARNAGVEPLNFAVTLVYFPAFGTCAFDIAPSNRRDASGRTVNEFLLNGVSRLEALTKVLGFSKGLDAAQTLVCADSAGKPVPLSTNCAAAENDPYTVMGANGGTMDLNVVAKLRTGWLASGTQVPFRTVAQGGTFTIAPIEAAATGTVRGLNVQDGSQNFVIEYRQPIGVDTGTRDATDGVLVYRQVVSGPPGNELVTSFLLDMTPGTGGRTFTDAVLRAGQSWTDPLGNLKITVNSANAAGASVTLSAVGTIPTNPTTAPPTTAPATTAPPTTAPPTTAPPTTAPPTAPFRLLATGGTDAGPPADEANSEKIAR